MHPVTKLSFNELLAGLQEEESNGYIRSQTDRDLAIFSYTDAAVYEKQWNSFTLSARGLILDLSEKRIVALPFPKFFNYSETPDGIPASVFEIFEKMDGSLIILFNYKNQWKTATRGSFDSFQAKFAQETLKNLNVNELNIEITYLFELIGPNNKIVVFYPKDELILLAAFNRNTGKELEFSEIQNYGEKLKTKVVNRFNYISLLDLVEKSETLTKNEEGFVIRFENGLRLKIKGAEYILIHRLISSLSPLSIWEMMKDSPAQLESMRKELPEELWADFDTITSILSNQLQVIISDVSEYSKTVKTLSDKDLGLILNTLPEKFRKFIFPYRKYGDLLEGKTRDAIYRFIRPNGNQLNGYLASSSINRIKEN